MKRLFGEKKKAPPSADHSLAEAQDHLNQQLSTVEAQLKRCQDELEDTCRASLSMHDNSSLKQKSLALLRKKKLLEQHRNQLFGTQLTVQQAKSTQDSVRTAFLTREALELGTQQMKQELKKLDLEKLEDLQGDLADLTHEHQAISDALSLHYAVPDLLDEAELEEEFARLVQHECGDHGVHPRPSGVPEPRAPEGSVSRNHLPSYFPDELFSPVPQHKVGLSPTTSSTQSGLLK